MASSAPSAKNSNHSLHSRFAPTPSGWLHLGNAYNFLLTWLWTRHLQGHLHLRIDDVDQSRVRRSYVEDVFRQLAWLGLHWDSGPQSPDELQQQWSQTLRLQRYRGVLQQLRDAGHLYFCSCSRKQVEANATAQGLYAGTCRNHPPKASAHGAWRLRLPTTAVVALADASSRHHSVDLNAELGDFIVWRRDQVPAYQLASCVDDLDLAINFWVRGEDLRVSSAAQLWLRRLITDEVAPLSFLHHPLLTREGGAKLSKSEADVSLAGLREQGLRLDEVYSAFAAWLGLPHAKEIASLSELQHAFSTHHSSEVS